MIQLIEHILGIGVIAGQGMAVVLFGFLVARKPLPGNLERLAFPAAATVAFASMFGSLFFSQVVKLEPCELCWFQRILMYPQVLLLGLAAVRNEAQKIVPYSLALSIPGLAIALYHITIQLGASPIVPCTSSGFGVSCVIKQVNIFGYITIPVMAATAFALLILGMIFTHRHLHQPLPTRL